METAEVNGLLERVGAAGIELRLESELVIAKLASPAAGASGDLLRSLADQVSEIRRVLAGREDAARRSRHRGRIAFAPGYQQAGVIRDVDELGFAGLQCQLREGGKTVCLQFPARELLLIATVLDRPTGGLNFSRVSEQLGALAIQVRHLGGRLWTEDGFVVFFWPDAPAQIPSAIVAVAKEMAAWVGRQDPKTGPAPASELFVDYVLSSEVRTFGGEEFLRLRPSQREIGARLVQLGARLGELRSLMEVEPALAPDESKYSGLRAILAESNGEIVVVERRDLEGLVICEDETGRHRRRRPDSLLLIETFAQETAAAVDPPARRRWGVFSGGKNSASAAR